MDVCELINGILQNVISTGIVAVVSAIFIKRYTRDITFSSKMKNLGFNSVAVNKQSKAERKDMFQNADEICILNVAGTHFLNDNKQLIKSAIDEGKHIRFLCSHPYSDFLNTIESMEVSEGVREKGCLISEEIFRNVDEFNNPRFEIRFFSDAYRLPLIIAKYPGDKIKVWLTVTLPPYKSTQSFILRGESGEDKEFISMAVTHFESVWKYASVSLDDFKKNIVSVQQKNWYEKVQLAKRTMESRSAQSDSVLIEVAAQHPLVDGLYPGDEFKGRLDEAIRISKDYGNVKFFIPGNIHSAGGKMDKISLSESGRNYLVSKGIPKESIITINDCAGLLGYEVKAYNSTDECRIASELFNHLGFGKLLCVCSPAQLMRKMFSYVGFSLYPEVHTFCCENMYHEYTEEFFRAIPILINDTGMFTGQSYEAKRLRKERE
ncbi:MAG: hypothetical protein ACI4A3_02075 [Lachnospiraceae bacterium]